MNIRDVVERIRRDVSMLDLAARYGIEMKRVGAQYRGYSPFRRESNPSFFIVPDKNFFKCFSTGIGGDPIKFVAIIENISTIEAIYKIAEWYNIPISLKEKQDYSDQFALRYRLANFLCEHMLETKNKGYLFLKERFSYANEDVLSKVIKDHLIGYINQQIYEQIRKLFTDKEFEIIGFVRKNRLLADDALVIPIYSNRNKIFMFLFRSLNEQSNKKYFYTVDSKKVSISELLYNYDHVFYSKTDTIYVVEGVLDVIAMKAAGIPNVVALLGIAVTENKVNLLKRFTKVVFNLDSDYSGHNAFLNYAGHLIPNNIFVYYISNKPFKDPDEAIKNGLYDTNTIKNKETFIVDLIYNGRYNSPQTEYKYKSWLKKCVSKITDKDVKSIYYRFINKYYKRGYNNNLWSIEDMFFYYMLYCWRYENINKIGHIKVLFAVIAFEDVYRETLRANFLSASDNIDDYEYNNMLKYIPEIVKKMTPEYINKKIEDEFNMLLNAST